MSPFDLVWTKQIRDWRWLWLRKKRVTFNAPITAVDMTSITLAMPTEPAFLRLLEAEMEDDGWGA